MNGAGDVPFPTREQAGRELFAVRPRPGWGFLVVVVVTTALGYGLAYLAPERSPVLAITGAVGVLLVHLGVGGSGLLEKHRVCEHALVLGPTWPGATPYVVPLSSIDPQSIRLHHRANFLGRRLGGPGARNIRMAVYSTKAVTFTGLHYELAHDRLRRARRPWPSRRAGGRCTTTLRHRRRRRPPGRSAYEIRSHSCSRSSRRWSTPANRRRGSAGGSSATRLWSSLPGSRPVPRSTGRTVAHGRDERDHTPLVVPEQPRRGRIRG